MALFVRHFAAALALISLTLSGWAELPVARLHSLFPMGGRVGTTLEVTAEGSDLEEATVLRFDIPEVSGRRSGTNTSKFVVTIGAHVPPGLYEARVVGRFGASNPRFFSVGEAQEINAPGTNRTEVSAFNLSLEMTVNAFAPVAAADFYQFKIASNQSVFISCQGEPFDSKMSPVLLLYNSEGEELSRDRRDGKLSYQAKNEQNLVLKVHDLQFRGGNEFPYRLALTSRPPIEFIFPPARLSGSDRKFEVMGRNLASGIALPSLLMDGKPLSKLAVELDVPTAENAIAIGTPRPRRLAEAGLKSFLYRAPEISGSGTPLPVFVAAAPAQLEAEPNDPGAPRRIVPPCEIQGQFYPSDDVDCFEFEAKKGDIFWIEAISERLGQATDPFILVQRVTKDTKGQTSLKDVQELYDTDSNLGGAVFNTTSRDPAWRLEVPEESVYRVQIRDLFNRKSDPSRLYRLAIRREHPDFDLFAFVAPPPTFEKDKREAQLWSPLLRRNDTLLIKVAARRRDNFTGEIALQVTGLPDYAHPAEAVIAAGQNTAWISISSTDAAKDWTGAIQIVGRTTIASNSVARSASTATVVWDVADYNNEAARARLTSELVLAIRAEAAPFKIEAAQKSWQTAQTTSLSIPLRFTRSADFNEPVKLRLYAGGQPDPLKEWEVDGKAVQASVDLDLKQSKLANGAHQLFVLAQTRGKFRRLTADETAELEAAEKNSKVDAEKKKIQERLRPREVTALFASPLIKVLVNPAPTAAK
ncbi:MAG TPA: hypothetical protein VK633_03660 [Verrucomicrobiae bacterium]|nr:hypothetical protein [Verrucomicrobiae bacterium]